VKSATAKFVFVDEQQEEKNGEEKAWRSSMDIEWGYFPKCAMISA
jgi:hypothetical protein